jgi:hypothetical protein
MEELCYRCKGKGLCGKPCKILLRLKKFQPRVKLEFSGSAPEIFVGRYNYPRVFTGILAPEEYGNTERLSMPESWFREQASIERIMEYRSQLVYSRFQIDIRKNNRFKEVMQEIAIASKPVATEFKLKKKPFIGFQLDLYMPVVGNPAPLKHARLEENPHVERKTDYLVSDYDIKAEKAVHELYRADIPVSNIIKVLAAGLLGLKFQRKLVPSRWATTATDDIISRMLIKRIRGMPEISEFWLFNSEYLGNHYEILLLPQAYRFEVIEAKMPDSAWNPQHDKVLIMQDYESYFGRKDYAAEVSGAYYANRLALTEYLLRIRRQASCLVMRECRDEYYIPCGVGILREASRDAFSRKPEKFSALEEALQTAQKRMKLPIRVFTKKSKLLSEFKKQKRLTAFL